MARGPQVVWRRCFARSTVAQPSSRFGWGTPAWLMALTIACHLGAPPTYVPVARAAESVLTTAQLHDDWLGQARLRFGKDRSGKITPAEDAAGGCDGIINGKWGFHTALEDNPWWQIDLGAATPVGTVTIYNRCDRLAERAAHLRILASGDGKSFRSVYVHNGKVFFGQPDGHPLVVTLTSVTTRYLRLQLPGHTYFHLDEVQIRSPGSTTNIALGKTATQSSISQWSARLAGSADEIDWSRVVPATIHRGVQLADKLDALGVDVTAARSQLQHLHAVIQAHDRAATSADWRQVYFQTRQTIRTLAFANPLLDFDQILFVKRAPSMFPHLSDQYYGWWARPGGGLYLLKQYKTATPALQCLTTDWPSGNFLRPDLSFDGRRAVFAFSTYHADVADLRNKRDKRNLPEDLFYQLFEIDLATGKYCQLTHGKYDDFDGRYLPNGQIVFLSTRKGQFLQTSMANTQKTMDADLPDSYVRCGGDDYRPVPVFTLHAMNGDGRHMRPISAFETFEYSPSIANDGRVLYCRWDYIDRFNGFFFSLWATNADGTNAQLVYGNVTKSPQATFEPRGIPNSHKIVFTAAAHHSVTGGSLVLLDPSKGHEGDGPITRLTPEVPFPETEKNVGSYYVNPWPLSEDFYLVSWSNRRLPPHGRYEDARNPVNAQGIYLYDRFGNLELLYRDPKLSGMTPIPVRPRPRPPVAPNRVAWDGPQVGQFLVQDVYQGLIGVPRGTVKRLRIVGVVPKVQPRMNQPSLGVSREETGKFILGSVPVEADGSAFFQVPSGLSVFFQALDADGYALQTMRSLTYVQPGETLACVGCHEPRRTTPLLGSVSAMQRQPARLTAGPAGSWPLRFDALVQPVLDQHCVSCHQPSAGNRVAAALNLRPDQAWQSLITFADSDLRKQVFERDESIAGASPARRSRLVQLLTNGSAPPYHQLSTADLRRIITWIDTYAQTQGAFSRTQEAQLRAARHQWQTLFVDSHGSPSAPASHAEQ